MPKEITLVLDEPKKHSGKYLVKGTENDTYPSYMYLKKEWVGERLPKEVKITIEPTA